MYCGICKDFYDLDSYQIISIKKASYGIIFGLQCDFCNTKYNYTKLYDFA